MEFTLVTQQLTPLRLLESDSPGITSEYLCYHSKISVSAQTKQCLECNSESPLRGRLDLAWCLLFSQNYPKNGTECGKPGLLLYVLSVLK